MTTRAIILAAGRGSRMREMTEDRPKGLVELAGKPLVGWQTNALRQAGIDEIVIVTGYRGAQLAPYADRTVENADWATTNMVTSLMCAAGEIDRPVIISYSDIVYSPDAVRQLAGVAGETAMAYDRDWLSLWSRRFDDPLSDAETFRAAEDGSIAEIGGKTDTLADIQGQYMGLLRFTPATIAAIRAITTEGERARLDMTGLLMRLIRSGHRIQGTGISGGWCEVDSVEDLKLANELVAEGKLTPPASA